MSFSLSTMTTNKMIHCVLCHRCKDPQYGFSELTGSQVTHTNLHCAHTQVGQLHWVLFGQDRMKSVSEGFTISATPSVLRSANSNDLRGKLQRNHQAVISLRSEWDQGPTPTATT